MRNHTSRLSGSAGQVPSPVNPVLDPAGQARSTMPARLNPVPEAGEHPPSPEAPRPPLHLRLLEPPVDPLPAAVQPSARPKAPPSPRLYLLATLKAFVLAILILNAIHWLARTSRLDPETTRRLETGPDLAIP